MRIVRLDFFPRTERNYTNRVIVLVTGQLSIEIEEIMAEIGRLFGVLNEDVVQLYY